jgi:hypothetical protein
MSRGGRLEVDLPDGWFRIDIGPAARGSARRLVDTWIERHPALGEHRDSLIDLLVSTAEHARATRCVYAAAAFGEQQGVGPTYAGLAVRILGWPGNADDEQFVAGMAAAARDDDNVTSAEVVQVAGRRMVLVRQSDPDGSVTTSFVVPARERGVFVNAEFSSPAAPAPEHTFAHIVATLRVR